MASPSFFGGRFHLLSFGESHGVGLGCVIDGCPSEIAWDQELLQKELDRRRPGQKSASGQTLVSPRNEADQVEIISGVYQNKTLGTPICALVRNQDARSQDYAELASGAKTRGGHADDMWLAKFGFSDPRGGGRSSGRETLARVIGGAVAQMMFKKAVPQLKILSFLSTMGSFVASDEDKKNLFDLWQKSKYPADAFAARFPNAQKQTEIESSLVNARDQGESFGAEIELWVEGAPKGLGQPVFHKLKSDLASALMSVGAVTSVEIGSGTDARSSKGTEFHYSGSSVYGGIRGGISTGERITLRATIKPTSSILETAKKGRHDPCIGIRAAPVLEAMVWLTLADHWLWAKSDRV